MEKTHYLLISPLAQAGARGGLTYHWPEPLQVGQVVKVPLRNKQVYGVVTGCSSKPKFATKKVTEVVDIHPLPPYLCQLAEWISAYYCADPGSVWQMMLPTGIQRKRRAVLAADSFKADKQDHKLTAQQKKALTEILESRQQTHLLQGVTGSGKTLIYLKLAEDAIGRNRSAIILIPEIALTAQLIAAFEAHFPGQVLSYHSGLSESQRHQVWQKAHTSDTPLIVIGPRSSLFVPVPNPGLIVVDECHETSYKQDQTPRYHAVTTAAKLASLCGAKLVLGSATPGLWEVFLAHQGKISLSKITERVAGLSMPTAEIIDLRDKELFKSSRYISEPLLDALKVTFKQNRQSLLFINRRGSASSRICGDCGDVSKCPNCSLPLTLHADVMKLTCHLCNWQATPTATCSQCGSSDIRYVGSGTKRIEAEIISLLPKARLSRIDRDSLNPKTLHQLYRELHSGDIDILIGTQMIAKGLDLPKLDIIGVINADTMLHIPDFSAAERTFQLLSQVSGRAGRRQPGKVFIQTHTPDHPAIQQAARHDFWSFAEAELANRRLMGYPPYRYLLKLTYSHAKRDKVEAETGKLLERISGLEKTEILGPAPAFHERAGGLYQWHIIIKSPARGTLQQIADKLPAGWKADLDPTNLL